ncbi:MAG: sugar phosphate isomerase/epimerase [Woeseiaceae bacterium]|jgi:sugar phosphate isomerase/epimerase
MDRRTFMLGAAAFVTACSRPDRETVAGEVADAPPLGVQLYSVRDLMAQDVAATLDLVASIGFAEVEFAGYFDHTPAEMRRMLNAAGLKAPAAHIAKNRFRDEIDRVIEEAIEVGHGYVIVPWLSEEERSLGDYRRHAEDFNRYGEACAAAGIQFAYHNHAFEFDETDGEIPYDVLLAETDPALVQMELDLAWARAGNADTLAYLTAWPGRFPMFHLKDLRAGEEADIGTGEVDFDTILAHAGIAGLKHGFVERDNATEPAASLRANLDAMRPLWSKYMAAAAAG